jgi:hypothetical protein
MTNWIYESPDGGKTLFRRPVGNMSNVAKEQMVIVDTGSWFAMSDLIKMAKRSIDEQCLRSEYPALNDTWNSYQTMLKLLSYKDQT